MWLALLVVAKARCLLQMGVCKAMLINEIYYALSGEGINVGVPTTIVRTQGCNLRCTYCDSKYTLGDGGVEMSVDSIMLKSDWPCWALISGGESLLQLDLHELVRALRKKGVPIEIETNGSLAPPKWWKEVDSWNADIKCPSSGMCGKSKLDWLGTRSCDQVKFVVSDGQDLEFVHSTVPLPERLSPHVLVSPVYPWTQAWLQRCTEFCKQYVMRLSLQQQKIVFGDIRGV